MAESKQEKPISSYHYGVVVSPMAGKMQEYDAPIGELLRRAALWRYTAIVLLGVSVLLAFLLLGSIKRDKPAVAFAGVEHHGDQIITAGWLKRVDKLPQKLTGQQIQALLASKLNVKQVRVLPQLRINAAKQ